MKTYLAIGSFLLGMALSFLEIGPHYLGGGIAAMGLAYIAFRSRRVKGNPQNDSKK